MEYNELPKLTKQQNDFVFHLFTDCIGKRAKAYKLSYDCKNSSEKTIYEEASKLLKNPNITPWIKHYEKSLQDFQESEIKYTRQDFFEELERIRSKTEDTKNISVALKAVELKGKAAGHLKDGAENTNNVVVQMGSIEHQGKDIEFDVGSSANETPQNSGHTA